MNLMQQLLIARSAARDYPEHDARPRARRGLRLVLKLVMAAMVIDAAIHVLKFWL